MFLEGEKLERDLPSGDNDGLVEGDQGGIAVVTIADGRLVRLPITVPERVSALPSVTSV